jgi:hypothetical protein
MLKPSTLALALAVPFLLPACSDDPPAPSDVRARISGDLGHVLREGVAAGTGGAAAFHSDAAFGLIERFGGPSTQVYSKRVAPLIAVVNNKFRINSPDDYVSDGSVTTTDTDRLIEELNTKLFTDANHVGDGVYKIPASFVCTSEEGLDAECAQQFDKIQLRVRTAIDDNNLTLALQVGANHDEPLRFSLSHTSLAITVDLDETSQAMTALAGVFGEAPPNASMSGEITSQIDILGTASARLALRFTRPLNIAVAEAGIALDGPDATRFTSAAANVATLTFDGGAGTGSVVVALGTTTVHLPSESSDFETSPAIDLDLAGASMIAMLATGQPLQITHVGLGDHTTTLDVDGQRAVSIDLNPNDGRAFGATISHDDASGFDTITVTPKLDLNVAIDHAVLGDEAPVYDVTRVLLEGSLRGSADADRIEVVSGTFAVSTNPAEFGFTATAGQCVTPTLVDDATTGGTYDLWSAGTCN